MEKIDGSAAGSGATGPAETILGPRQQAADVRAMHDDDEGGDRDG
jgi:hypothetical protein